MEKKLLPRTHSKRPKTATDRNQCLRYVQPPLCCHPRHLAAASLMCTATVSLSSLPTSPGPRNCLYGIVSQRPQRELPHSLRLYAPKEAGWRRMDDPAPPAPAPLIGTHSCTPWVYRLGVSPAPACCASISSVVAGCTPARGRLWHADPSYCAPKWAANWPVPFHPRGHAQSVSYGISTAMHVHLPVSRNAWELHFSDLYP